jgi:hypothetical protein
LKPFGQFATAVHTFEDALNSRATARDFTIVFEGAKCLAKSWRDILRMSRILIVAEQAGQINCFPEAIESADPKCACEGGIAIC